MVAYLLTPDRENPALEVKGPNVDYDPIPIGVQHVRRISTPPDAETWRAVRRLMDSGPRVTRKGRIDLRECAYRIARKELIETLPRVKVSRHATVFDVLVDVDLRCGPFSSDVEHLDRSLRSVGSNSLRVRGLAHRTGSWYMGDGPIWTFGGVEVLKGAGWVIVVTGKTATADRVERVHALVAKLRGVCRSVSVVWIGDVEGVGNTGGTAKWIPFR